MENEAPLSLRPSLSLELCAELHFGLVPENYLKPVLGTLHKWFNSATKIAWRIYDIEEINFRADLLRELELPVRFNNLVHLTMWDHVIGHDTFMNLLFCSDKLSHLSIRFGLLTGFKPKEFSECVQQRKYKGLHLTRRLKYLCIQPLSDYPLSIRPYHVLQLLAGVEGMTNIAELQLMVLSRADVRLLCQNRLSVEFPDFPTEEAGYLAAFDKDIDKWLFSFYRRRVY